MSPPHETTDCDPQKHLTLMSNNKYKKQNITTHYFLIFIFVLIYKNGDIHTCDIMEETVLRMETEKKNTTL